MDLQRLRELYEQAQSKMQQNDEMVAIVGNTASFYDGFVKDCVIPAANNLRQKKIGTGLIVGEGICGRVKIITLYLLLLPEYITDDSVCQSFLDMCQECNVTNVQFLKKV